ncbi:SCL-interrupting locus protein homolog isoform X2 [Branchiostoma floridae]|uniref:SCL-interrupting locus protein homolog isoform X2 n=1 Tax=Branchiostoma floridae TaxID=7739 RepID=A0A9J7NCL7_BRAFL|nr:SCL-interrupting locus protein homolog isoform X2 [Branchiostoma floridae]
MSVRVDMSKMPAHVRDSAYFVSKDNSSGGKGRKRSTENTGIVPLSFPATRAVLWSRTPTGTPSTLHLTHYRNCHVLVLEKTLRLAQRHALQAEDTPFSCFLIGCAVVDSDEEGVTVTLDRFDPGRSVPGRADRIPTASLLGDHVVHTSITLTKRAPGSEASVTSTKEVFTSTLKSLHHHCCTKDPVDVSNSLALQAHIYVQDEGEAMTFDIHLSAVSMATGFEATPVTPVPIIPTALARNLAGPLNLSEVQGAPKSGFLTMDQTRKLLLLLESDPKIYSLPLVGIWVCGPVHIHSPHIWACCLRYMYNTNIQDRVYTPMQGFLVVLYSPTHSQPEFYDCRTKDGVMNFQLHNCFETLHVLKDAETMDKRPLHLELVPAEDGQNFALFQQALKDMDPIECPTAMSPDSAMKRMFPGENSNHGNNHHDSPVPRPSPSPHPLSGKSPVVQPLVPELSMVFDSFCEILPQNVNKLNDSLLDKENQNVNHGGKHVHFAPSNTAPPKGAQSPHTHASPQGRQPLRNYNYQTPPQGSNQTGQKQHSGGKHTESSQSANSKQDRSKQSHGHHSSNIHATDTHDQRKGVTPHPHGLPVGQNFPQQRHPGPANPSRGYTPHCHPSAANPHVQQQQQRFAPQPDSYRHPPPLPAGPRQQFHSAGPGYIQPYGHPVGSTQGWSGGQYGLRPQSGQMPQNGQMRPNGQMPPNGQMRPSGQMQLNGQMRPNGQMQPNSQMPQNGQIPRVGPPRQGMVPRHRPAPQPYSMPPPPHPQVQQPHNQDPRWQPPPPVYPPQQASQPPNHQTNTYRPATQPYGQQTLQETHPSHTGILKNHQQPPVKSQRSKKRHPSHGTPQEGHHHGNTGHHPGNRHPPQAVHFTPSPHQMKGSHSAANQQQDSDDEALSPANQSEGYHSELEQSDVAANQEESCGHAQSGMSPHAYKLLMQQDAQLKMLMAQIQRLLGAQPNSGGTEQQGTTPSSIPPAVNHQALSTDPSPSTNHQPQGTQINDENNSDEGLENTATSVADFPEVSPTGKRTASIAINTGTSLYWGDTGSEVISHEEANQKPVQVSCDTPDSLHETAADATLPKSSDHEGIKERSGYLSHDHMGTNERSAFTSHDQEQTNQEGSFGMNLSQLPVEQEAGPHSSMVSSLHAVDIESYAGSTPSRSPLDSEANHQTSMSQMFQSPVLGESASMCVQQQQTEDGEEEEERLNNPTSFRDEEHFYQQILGQVNQLLHSSSPDGGPQKEPRLSLPAHPSASPAPKPRRLSESALWEKEHQRVVKATRKQLKRMGAVVEEEQQHSRKHMDHHRPSAAHPSADFIPKINYISLSEMALEGTGTDLSFEANAIAMKYLSDDQLANLPLTPAHHGNQAPSPIRSMSANQSLLRGMFRGRGMRGRTNFEVTPVNMSMATWKYMRRYGLIEEEDEETSQVFSPPKEITSRRSYSSSESDLDEEQHSSRDSQGGRRESEEASQGRAINDSKECSCCSGSSHGSSSRSGRQRDNMAQGEDPIVVFPEKWKGRPRRQSSSPQFEDDEGSRVSRGSSETSGHREGTDRETRGRGAREGSGETRNILDLGKLRQMPKLL